MRRYFCLMFVILAFTAIACPPAPPPIDPPKKDEVKGDKTPQPVENVAQLKPRIEGALELVYSNELTTKHGFWTVFHGILGMGPDKTMITDVKTGKKVKAIDYICEGGELPGLKFEPTKDGLDVYMSNDLTFLAQGHQDQFVAEMAQWGMTPDHKFRVGKNDYTFNDFIKQSTMRASVTQKQELSWAIIMISQFHGTNYQWTNSLGERLHFDDVVRYEIDASIDESACGGTHRLFGFTWAYHLHLKNGGKKEGVWLDVAAKIEHYKALAKRLQNRDGTLSNNYFKGPGADEPDTNKRIGATGHILEWLALAMTDKELREPWMQNAVNALVQLILDLPDRADGGGLYHAAHGLHIYHERVFGMPAAYLPLVK
jgi:hypothetical protein